LKTTNESRCRAELQAGFLDRVCSRKAQWMTLLVVTAKAGIQSQGHNELEQAGAGSARAERTRRFLRTVERDADLSEQPIAG
jgi:hypothetical protein